MLMPVMNVWVMRMGMSQPRVLVAMGMRFASRIVKRMRVLMMLVVVVEMFVFHRVVDVLVFVSFGDVQPNADQHAPVRAVPR